MSKHAKIAQGSRSILQAAGGQAGRGEAGIQATRSVPRGSGCPQGAVSQEEVGPVLQVL